MWLLVLKIFNMHTDINACNCTWVGWGGSGGLYKHAKRVCTESLPWEKNCLLRREAEPASAACWMQHLSTELRPHPIAFIRRSFLFLLSRCNTLYRPQLFQIRTNLKQNKAQSTCAESTLKGVNLHLKYVTQVTCMPCESYCRWLRSLLLDLCYMCQISPLNVNRKTSIFIFGMKVVGSVCKLKK